VKKILNNIQIINGLVVWGVITANTDLITALEKELSTSYGNTIFRSEIIDFNYTNYYEREMGKNLKRCWLVTENFVPLDQLAKLKHYAIMVEAKFQNHQGQRSINIDPGFLTLSNFVLATTKNYGHRIYLKDGIFAEVTLIYRNKSYHALDWTYPDYRNAINFFNEARNLYITLSES
jgi:hypothetical protein